MHHNTKIKPLTESGILTSIAILLALISAYIPVLGFIAALVWPVPVIVLGVRHGYRWSILATVAAGLIMAMLLQPLTALQAVLGFGSIGIVLGHCFHRRYSPLKTMVAASVVSFIGTLAVLALASVVMGINPLAMQADLLAESFTQAMDMYRTTGMFSEEQLQQMEAVTTTSLQYMKVILPGIVVLSAVIYATINYATAKTVLKKLGHVLPSFPPFAAWQLPRVSLLPVLLVPVCVYIGKTQDIELLTAIGLNGGVLAMVVFGVEGLSLFYYFADKYNLSRLVKGIILFLIFTNNFVMQLIFFAGMWDALFDYRKLRARPKPVE